MESQPYLSYSASHEHTQSQEALDRLPGDKMVSQYTIAVHLCHSCGQAWIWVISLYTNLVLSSSGSRFKLEKLLLGPTKNVSPSCPPKGENSGRNFWKEKVLEAEAFRAGWPRGGEQCLLIRRQIQSVWDSPPGEVKVSVSAAIWHLDSSSLFHFCSHAKG